jgi:hypothetical protein
MSGAIEASRYCRRTWRRNGAESVGLRLRKPMLITFPEIIKACGFTIWIGAAALVLATAVGGRWCPRGGRTATTR